MRIVTIEQEAAELCRKCNPTDDFEKELAEWYDLVDYRYRDSLIAEGVADAEDYDFARKRWLPAFIAKLLRFVEAHRDDSVGCASLAKALQEATPRAGGRYVVWLGPTAREWMRQHIDDFRAVLKGRYRFETKGV